LVALIAALNGPRLRKDNTASVTSLPTIPQAFWKNPTEYPSELGDFKGCIEPGKPHPQSMAALNLNSYPLKLEAPHVPNI
jgi:hypothetical protein